MGKLVYFLKDMTRQLQPFDISNNRQFKGHLTPGCCVKIFHEHCIAKAYRMGVMLRGKILKTIESMLSKIFCIINVLAGTDDNTM